MEAYLQALVNFEQNDWARLFLMAKFAYNNAKNASTGYTPFKINCGYHFWVSYKEDIDPCSKSKSVDDLVSDLGELMVMCRENLQYTQDFQKRVYNKGTKPRSFAPSNKVWLNSKYIKTKRNWKLEAKFFGPFRVLHPLKKQVYKLKLPKKWKIHDVFNVSLLEQDITTKGRSDKNVMEFKVNSNDKKYKLEGIWNSAVYVKELAIGHLSDLYYLVSWKGYPKKENT